MLITLSSKSEEGILSLERKEMMEVDEHGVTANSSVTMYRDSFLTSPLSPYVSLYARPVDDWGAK